MFKKLRKFLATALVTTVLATGLSFVANDNYNLGIQTAHAENTHSTTLVRASEQSWSLANSGQTGLDVGGDFTMQGWFKLPAQPDDEVFSLISKWGASGGTLREYWLYYRDQGGTKTLVLSVSDTGDASANYIVTPSFSNDTWYHIAVTFDENDGVSNSHAKFYVVAGTGDTSQLGATQSDSPITLNQGAGIFGLGVVDSSGLGNWINGEMDDWRVYNAVRTLSAINLDKDEELVGNETNLVGYWTFDDEADPTADETANNNDLDGTGTPTFTTDVPFSDAATITLTEFTDESIFQRDSTDDVDITVSGTYTGTPTNIEYRIVEDATTTPVTGHDWQTLEASPTGNTFSGTASDVPQGDGSTFYNVDVRFSNDTGTLDEGANTWGVGALFVYTGQSQATRAFSEGTDNTADVALRYYNGTWTDPTTTGNGAIQFGNTMANTLDIPIGLLNYGVGGSALLASSDPAKNWLSATVGQPYPLADIGVQAVGGNIEMVIWMQGEDDATTGETPATYVSGLGTLFTTMRSDWGSPYTTLPILQTGLGRTTDLGTDAGWNGIRQAIMDYIASDANTRLAGTTVGFTLADNVHYNNAGQTTLNTWIAQTALFVTGDEAYYRGPRITGLNKVNTTTVDISLAYTNSDGSDFTPTSAITDFDLLDDGSGETITSATRQNANTIRLVTSGSLDGTITARYMYGTNPTITGIVEDNGTLTLPLETKTLIEQLELQTDNNIFALGMDI